MIQPQPQLKDMTHPTSGISKRLLQQNIRVAKRTLGLTLSPLMVAHLKILTHDFGFSIQAGELQIINTNWYVTPHRAASAGAPQEVPRHTCRGGRFAV